MTKADQIAILASRSGLPIAKAGEVYEDLVALILERVALGDPLTVTGLGTFRVTQRAARQGRNPNTGAAIQVPAKRAVKFTAAKAVKDAVG